MLTTLLGGRAFAEKFGSGPATVVALHGWGRNRQDFATTLEGYDALSLDLPGFGATPEPDSGWSTVEYADWTAEILEALDRPVLVGHSFGGRVAIRVAAKYPELVSGVVLTGVPLLRGQSTGGRPAWQYRLVRALHRRGLVGEKRMEELRERYGSADYRAAHGVMREVLVKAVNESYEPELAAVAAHGLAVVLVWGEHDTAATVAMAEQARAMLGEQTRLVVVPGSAHLLDAALVRELRAAIEELRR